MKQPIVSVASAVFFVMSGASAQSITPADLNSTLKTEAYQVAQVDRIKQLDLKKPNKSVFNSDKSLTGKQTYIVRFTDEPLTSYAGKIPGLASTTLQIQGKGTATAPEDRKFNAKSAESIAYSNYLEVKQDGMLNAMSQKLARSLQVERRFKAAINGITVQMTQDEAAELASLPGIVSIQPDRIDYPDTDRGPTHIGAAEVWAGAIDSISARGEGLVLGILDSGIHGDHPSFAAESSDGFVHTNPLGSGNFLGECDPASDVFNSDVECNDKLIGRYLFIGGSTTEDNSEDTDGHGTHVASTAGGNALTAPVLDAEGTETGITLDISGVAPRANIVAFQVCAPGCSAAGRVAAVEQAILDGVVDVMNHSIGSRTPVTIDPWTDAVDLAFLSARAAGITVVNSMGNNGPNPSTLGSSGAPWITNVGSFSHDREIAPKEIGGFAGGDTAPPPTIFGAAITAGLATAPIVYAGDFSNGDVDPEQCLNPFPADTWTNGEIVVCDRGSIARVQKCINVRDGGAAGCVLANVDGGASSLANDAHVIPSIHIAAADGNALKAWLATGSDHTAAISDSLSSFGVNPALANIAADSTSRGPHLGQDYQPLSVGAPGRDIYAALADGTEFGFLSGTSMASPHVAGASILMKQLRPDWTDAEILSALATTATTEAFQEDGVTPATPFDVGGGVIRVDRAAQAGLLLDETVADFEAANPGLGGDPKALNVAGMVNRTCAISCSWERTVEATTSGDWTVTTSDPGITVSPDSFSLLEGESQTIQVSVDATQFPVEEWSHGQVDFTSDAGVPDQHLTLSFIPVGGEIPELVEIAASRSSDSFLVTGIESPGSSNLQVMVNGLSTPTTTTVSLVDAASNPFADLTTGIHFELFDVTSFMTRIVAATYDERSESSDVDLFLGIDSNGNGLPEQSEIVCSSQTFTATELCDVTNPESGEWWVLVQNWLGSPTAPDDIEFDLTLVDSDEGNMMVTVPSSVDSLVPYDMRLIYDIAGVELGDVVHGTVTLGTGPDTPDNIGTVPVTITRVESDVIFSVDSNATLESDTLTFTATIAVNDTPEDRTYSIGATIPEGFTLVPGSVTGGGLVTGGDTIAWSVTQPSTVGALPSYNVVTSNEDPACALPFANSGSYVDLEAFNIFPDTSLSGDGILASAFSAQNFNFFGRQFVGGFLLTEDGFVTFSGGAGPTPFINREIPDVAVPNEIVAGFWRDLEVPTPSAIPGEVVGISLASIGADFSLIEYDNVIPFASDGSETIDFQIGINGAVSDAPGDYEILVAFDNIGITDQIGTIGVEDAEGLTGTQFAFNNIAVTDGMGVCFDLIGATFETVELSYQVTVDTETAGLTIDSDLTHDVDTIGTEEAVETVSVDVLVRGDYDGDGDVDINDVRSLTLDIQNNEAIDLIFDLNADGVVNILDARVMMSICTRASCAP